MRQAYHFLGIGGIGMSALAHVLHERGDKVSGFDIKGASHLHEIGITLTQTPPEHSTIVYSSAIMRDHPDLIVAKRRHFPLMHRSDLLRVLLRDKLSLLVTGTHGKTSTSALLSWVLKFAGLQPTYAVGGILRNFNKNGGMGMGPYFVAEADESDGSFLNYHGHGAIITNIEKEHLDYWKTEKKLIMGFEHFMTRVKNSDLLFWNGDDPILRRLNFPGISYGKSGALCMQARKQQGVKEVFTATFKGNCYSNIELPLIGEPNVLNALAVFGMALQIGISDKEIRQAFLSYRGVKRRLEKIGEINRIVLYDDYAHHPTEVRVVIAALREVYKKRRLIMLFQPHRYTRIQMLDFSESFDLADLVIITDIYAGGERMIEGVDAASFQKRLRCNNTIYLPRKNLSFFLPKMLVPGDVLVVAGAGDISDLNVKELLNNSAMHHDH